MHTLIGTAKLNDVDPQAWLADALRRFAELPQSRPPELLPWNWKVRRHPGHAALAAAFTAGSRLTPELTELIKRTFRGVHLLAFLEREEFGRADREEDLRRAAEAETLGTDEPGPEA